MDIHTYVAQRGSLEWEISTNKVEIFSFSLHFQPCIKIGSINLTFSISSLQVHRNMIFVLEDFLGLGHLSQKNSWSEIATTIDAEEEMREGNFDT